MATNIGGARDKTAGRMARSGWLEPDTALGWAATSNIPAMFGAEKGTDLRRRALESKKETEKREQGRTQAQEMAERASALETERAEADRVLRSKRAIEADRAAREQARRSEVLAGASDRAAQEQIEMGLREDRRKCEERVATGDMSALERGTGALQLAERQKRAEAEERNRQAIRPLESERAIATASQDQAQQSVLELTRQREQAEARLERERQAGGGVPAIQAQTALDEITKSLAAATEQSAIATDKRLQTERAISAERIRGADEAMKRTQDEIDVRKSMIEAERDAYRTAEERFGLLPEAQQQQILSLKDRFDAKEDIGVKGMQLLAQYGTVNEQEALGAYARKRPKGTRFEKTFGQEEPQRIAAEQRKIAPLEVKVQANRDYRVQLEVNTDEVVDRLTATIAGLWRKQELLIDSKVAAGVEAVQRQQSDGASRRASSIPSR